MQLSKKVYKNLVYFRTYLRVVEAKESADNELLLDTCSHNSICLL